MWPIALASVAASAAPGCSRRLGRASLAAVSRAAGGDRHPAGPAARRRLSSVGRPRATAAPLVLVLDLDETLVRVRCEGVHHDRRLDKTDYTVSVDLATPPKSRVFECSVSARPGLPAFLEWIKEQRRAGAIEGPWIYTTSSAKYTKALLRQIDPGGHIFAMRVLTRSACSSASLPGFFLKDLDRIPPSESGAARRKVLVDNNPVSHVLHPDSAVLVRDWLGSDPGDSELPRVQALLERMLSEGAGDAGEPGEPGCLAAAVPGHAAFRERLLALRTQLAAPVPAEVPLLRDSLRAVAAECHAIKRELLGAAP